MAKKAQTTPKKVDSSRAVAKVSARNPKKSSATSAAKSALRSAPKSDLKGAVKGTLKKAAPNPKGDGGKTIFSGIVSAKASRSRVADSILGGGEAKSAARSPTTGAGVVVGSPIASANVVSVKKTEPGVDAVSPAARVQKGGKKTKAAGLAIDRLADLAAQWSALFEKSKGIEAAPYKMSATYSPRTPIHHKVLGWGYVLSNQNDRLEVLFKDGIKILISNYKGS